MAQTDRLKWLKPISSKTDLNRLGLFTQKPPEHCSKYVPR